MHNEGTRIRIQKYIHTKNENKTKLMKLRSIIKDYIFKIYTFTLCDNTFSFSFFLGKSLAFKIYIYIYIYIYIFIGTFKTKGDKVITCQKHIVVTSTHSFLHASAPSQNDFFLENNRFQQWEFKTKRMQNKKRKYKLTKQEVGHVCH